MAVIKCKMCGGDMEMSADKTFGTCEYCGSTMTLPKVDSEQRASAFNRGNHFRRMGEFDKALAVYERIVAEDDTDAEAHWCCALCRFGIEYVEDPGTYEYLPTCHRASFDSFLEDVDYLAAVAHSDGITRRQYQKDAAKIAEVQKGILATSQNEEPFDVFICYKESDENGNRTVDSTLAQDIYYQLTEQGYRVFFSRITLEDKVGAEYEPYIFAALNSAKVMISVGTKPEYFNAVWVKNEWSRFLALMRHDRSKLLLPCYRDMDPYDLPEQLSVLQSYDMAKIGFIQDLIRGVGKVLSADKPEVKQETVVVNQAAANTEPLLKRAFMFLEDGDWKSADEYCEKVLDMDPECAMAYLGKLMAELKVKKQDALADLAQTFDDQPMYKKALRFADTALKAQLEGYNQHIRERNEQNRLDGLYNAAVKAMEGAQSREQYRNAAGQFHAILSWRDAADKEKECFAREETLAKNLIYRDAAHKATVDNSAEALEAVRLFESIPGWKDADQRAEECRVRAEELKRKEAEQQAWQEKLEKQQAARMKKRNRILAATISTVLVLIIAAVIVITQAIIPPQNYAKAEALLEAGETAKAAIAFGKLGNYQDARERSFALWDQIIERDTLEAFGSRTFGLKSDGTVLATGYGLTDTDITVISDWEDIVSVGYGFGGVFGLRRDGTVVVAGTPPERSRLADNWTDIVAIAAGSSHTVGLKSDGTVVATKYYGTDGFYAGQREVSDWTDIVAIAAGSSHTVGLKSDGTVVATKYTGRYNYGQCDVSGWTDIVAIAASGTHTVGLKSDGTVVSTKYNYYSQSDNRGQCDVAGWKDVVAIAVDSFHTFGLKSDGTVVATKYTGDQATYRGECDVSDWTDIIAIKTNMSHTIGLKSDGTVVATKYIGDPEYYEGECDVSGWTDIVAIDTDNTHTVGLKSDGTVVATKYTGGPEKYDGECDVSDWADVKLPNK